MLDSLLKNLGKVHFKYLSQEFDNNVLELTKPKNIYPYECMSYFEKLSVKISAIKNMNMF